MSRCGGLSTSTHVVLAPQAFELGAEPPAGEVAEGRAARRPCACARRRYQRERLFCGSMSSRATRLVGGEARGEIGRERRLAGAAFLLGDGDHQRHCNLPFRRPILPERFRAATNGTPLPMNITLSVPSALLTPEEMGRADRRRHRRRRARHRADGACRTGRGARRPRPFRAVPHAGALRPRQ